MINYLHSKLHRPENGWDPVSEAHVQSYTEYAGRNFDDRLVATLERRLNGLDGKRILDLGGGHGHYSVAFAKLGAKVVWYDVSKRYMAVAQKLATANNVCIDFSIGYLEDADRFADEPFDLVFCRACWYYSRGDRAFSRIVWNLIKRGGAAYIETDIPKLVSLAPTRRTQFLLNAILWFKVGHPFPPHGRVATLFQNRAVKSMHIDYSDPVVDKVFLTTL